MPFTFHPCRWKCWAPVLPAFMLLLCLGGCATYSAKFADLRPQVAEGRFDAALETVEKESGSHDRLLYHLERGLILHFAGRFPASNTEFHTAERLADELYTKSISQGAISLFTNDNAIDYRARPFEMAMVPYYKALNYLYLGEPEEAQVEARRASELLSRYVDATLKGVREGDGDRLHQVRNNAFLLYYSGMLYDSEGEVNDAFIAYRNAAAAFQKNHGLLNIQIPPELGEDLERVGRRLGFESELVELRKQCPDVLQGDEEGIWPPGQGEVVLLLETGFVAQKTQTRFDFPVFKDSAYDDEDYWAWEIYGGMGNMHAFTRGHKVEYWVSVAAPELQDAPGPIGGARVSAGLSGDKVRTSRTANLNREARITFDAEKPSIFFKTIARGLTKYLATRSLGKESKVAGALANIFGAVTETADTRSWLTLPENVHLARLTLPPGVHELTVEVLDREGHPVVTRTIGGVEVKAGKWTFVNQRVF